MAHVVLACVLAVVALGGLLAGPAVFAAAVVAVAAIALVDVCLLLARAGARPVLPVAFLPGVVLPAAIAAAALDDPVLGWDMVPGVFAAAVLAGFTLVLLFGRRDGAVAGLGATFTASLLVGLGAAALPLLRALPDGTEWVLSLLVLASAADLAGPAARRLRRRRQGDDDAALAQSPTSALLDGVVPAVGLVAVAGVALTVVFASTLQPSTTAMLGMVAVVGALGGGYLQRVLTVEAGAGADGTARLGSAVVLGVVDAVLLGAPAAYVLARSVSL